jgi:tetratricopeptide (TPR) repeat protein
MNALGYRYLQTGRTAEAIELFKLNVQAYPNSFNTYDSLGEAYVTNGDKDLAIKYYNRSLELNPDNSNAKEMLQRLK